MDTHEVKAWMHACIDTSMDAWMMPYMHEHERVDGCLDGHEHGWWMDAICTSSMDAWMHACMDTSMDGGWMVDRCVDGCVDGCVHGHEHGCVD